LLLHEPSGIFLGKLICNPEARQQLQARDQESAAEPQSR
jgi:hypothetical protein